MYSQIDGADKIIQNDIDEIVNTVDCDVSVYLFGSYGKGEGGFVNGKPVNDYDLLVLGDIKPEFELNIHVDVINSDTGTLPKTQQTFEIEHGSILLCGKDKLSRGMEPYDIPYEDAIKSLDRRAVSMLVGKYEMGNDTPDQFKIMTQISKMIIALGDAVLIKRGEFNVSYRTRSLMLQDDAIGDLYAMAVRHKVLCDLVLNADDLWRLWHDVKARYRDYALNNKVLTENGEVLINVDDRTDRSKLKQALEMMGATDWI